MQGWNFMREFQVCLKILNCLRKGSHGFGGCRHTTKISTITKIFCEIDSKLNQNLSICKKFCHPPTTQCFCWYHLWFPISLRKVKGGYLKDLCLLFIISFKVKSGYSWIRCVDIFQVVPNLRSKNILPFWCRLTA